MSEYEARKSAKHKPGTVRRLVCACCGGEAGRWAQWFNRDTGYGVCVRCVTWMIGRGKETPEEVERLYGKRGTHWGMTVQHYGRTYSVTAAFHAHEQAKANDWMEAHPREGLLTIADGLLILADVNDKGE